MHNLKFRTLAFYGVAIGSVLILFKVITLYGESHLKAPAAIDGRYRILFSEKPICEKLDPLILNIQQSGIYLRGFLLPANASSQIFTAAETHSNLHGTFNNQQLNLSGKVPRTILCNLINSRNSQQNNSFNLVTMQIKRVDKAHFIGQMDVNGVAKSIQFTAIPQQKEHLKSEK